jgi:hypothetical protein
LCAFKESPDTTMAFCLAKACSKLDQGKPRTEKCTTSELMCLCLSGGSAPLELGSTLGSHFPPPLTVATLVLVEKQRKQALLQSRISVKPGGMCVYVCLFLISFVVFPIILITIYFSGHSLSNEKTDIEGQRGSTWPHSTITTITTNQRKNRPNR